MFWRKGRQKKIGKTLRTCLETVNIIFTAVGLSMLKKKNEFPIHNMAFYAWKKMANQDMKCSNSFPYTKVHFSVVLQLLSLFIFRTFPSFDIGNTYCSSDAQPNLLVHKTSLCRHIERLIFVLLSLKIYCTVVILRKKTILKFSQIYIQPNARYR